MTLLYALNAAADDTTLPFAPTPVIQLPVEGPPKIHQRRHKSRMDRFAPRSLEQDTWLCNVTKDVILGRVLEDTTNAEGVHHIELSTGNAVDMKERNGHFYATRGRHNGASLHGDRMSLVKSWVIS